MFWKVGGILAIPRQPVDISGRTPLPPIGCSGRRDAQRQRLSSSKEKTMISVSPACLDLKPGSSVDMVLTASSDSPKILHERLVCDSIIGGHGIQETIMSVEVMCRFVSPKLSISSKQLNFYVKKGSLLPVYERLVLLNVSPLPLRLELSVTEPFSLCESPGENNSTTTKVCYSCFSAIVRRLELWVCFDPSLCTDLVSCILDKTLKIKYLEPQQQDIVKLHAEVHLPTLQFSSTTVDFGCLPKNTAAKKTITITNCSSVPLSYHWAFQKLPQIRYVKKHNYNSAVYDTHLLCSTNVLLFLFWSLQVFDILPIYGVLNPHDQQLMTFSFHSHENTCTEVVAQCYVEDGPTYIVQVRVEISEFSYSIESTHLDLGSFSDCDHGIVINSLDSIYTPCPSSTLQGVLKAFSNRKHIYVVNLFDSYVALKKQALQNEIAEQEERHLWELDQENFDALPDEEKENVTQRHLEAIQKKKER
uniref:Hydin adenylate kinase-like domain-containing protein n=1 Tax=Cyprinodon variegatus TaxID=28743 RepID=A0A3Q2E163_CYPVA